MHGHLIDPVWYHNHLQGATVKLHFELMQWALHTKGIDQYFADIVAIHVMISPKLAVVTPKKHKVLQIESPIKKAHIT